MAVLWMAPGAKLVHMGVELGQRHWADRRIAWELLETEDSLAHLQLVRDLNNLLRTQAPVQLITRETLTTTMIEAGEDALAFVRAGEAAAPLIVVANLRTHARAIALPAPCPGVWREILNTDSRFYGGSNVGNLGGVATREQDDPARPFVLDLLLPPSGALILRHDG
jgi:1,4-alpha-glucan branching enzyme